MSMGWGAHRLSDYRQGSIAEDALTMSAKRSKKVKKRQKALQRRKQPQPASKPRLLNQIPPENADQLAMTTTGEIMQPVRLHYEVLDGKQLRATFATLRCLDYDAPRQRWVWLYADEAKTITFKDRRAADNTVLGEFVFKGTEEVVLNLRSLERATHAITFFDQHLPRTVARVAEVTISNRLLSLAEASSLRSLDPYFERADVVVKDPESLLQTLKDMATSVPDDRERAAVVMQYMEEKAKQPVPAMERFPLHYYEEGIRSVEAFLAPHQVVAMQHWQGNTNYTRHDMMRDMIGGGAIPTGETDTMSLTEPSADSSLAVQLCALMESESYEDWLQAWELMRDHLPENVTTFRECEDHLDLASYGLFVNNFLDDLDMDLSNSSVDDPNLLEKRAEVSRWVYTQFTEESELNQGNFRGFEAESLWEMGQREQAETLFQELIEVFPNFAWGYIWWGDCYWMSDWSYVSGPDYDRAESLYRQALANSDLENRNDVQDRLDDLYKEQAHPEKRERIKQARLKHIPGRKSLE